MGNIEKFDQMAARYDTADRAVIAAVIGNAIRRCVEPGVHRAALDYGCGTGLVGLPLVDLFERMLLVDASENMVAQVSRKIREMGIQNAEAICADLMADPPPLRADCILVIQVLLHMREVEPLLARLWDALNPGGQLLIVDFVKNDMVQSADVHCGFAPDALSAQVQSLGFTCESVDVFYHGQRLFMNQDASLFLIDARKPKPGLRHTIAAGSRHSVALKADGSVLATGENKRGCCEVGDWRDVVAVAAGNVHMATNTGSTHTVGLRSDGTVVAVGWNQHGQCDVSDWRDIIAVAAGWRHTIGLKSDGTLRAAGRATEGQLGVDGWRDITVITAGDWHTVAVRADGTALAAGNNMCRQCDVGGWKHIAAVSAGYLHSVGLTMDGHVLATGQNLHGQCNVGDWAQIGSISAGSNHTVGLKADGTVVATGWNEFHQCDVGGWRDIVAIAAGSTHTLGLKSDGTLLATGNNGHHQCDVRDWRDLRLPALQSI